MRFRQFRLLYLTEGMDVKIVSLNSMAEYQNDEIRLHFYETPAEGGSILKIRVTADKPVNIQTCLVDWSLDPGENRRMLANGYQSWSETREYGENDKLHSLNRLASSMFHLRALGDYAMTPYPARKGQFHSWTYTSLRGETDSLFSGSLDERNGWTLYQGDLKSKTLRISKDLSGVRIENSLELFHLYTAYGDTPLLLDSWFRLSGIKPRPAPSVTGWTSWYYHYTDITESLIMQNMQALKKAQLPLDVFQVDDGWQEALGDWLDVNGKFPRGMEFIAAEAKDAGFKPGLWLAPFVCETRSKVYQEHKEWLLRDTSGRLVEAGWNPAWGAVFYALDIYHPEVRDYLRRVFATILDDWGFGLVKLDFLYAAALVHRRDIPRSRVMFDAMDLVRELAGERWILACGLPLAAGFGKVEYCRIGSDVAGYWEEKAQAFIRFRERISTKSSLESTIARSGLDRRAFGNDPDVFLLRSERNGLSDAEKHTLFLINNILGSLLFFSDDVRNYGETETRLFASMFPRIRPSQTSVSDTGSCRRIDFTCAGRNYLALTNMSDRPVKIPVTGIWFSEGAVLDNEKVLLQPHASRVFLAIPDDAGFAVIGTTGHLIPCCDVESAVFKADTADIRYHPQASRDGSVYIRVPEDCDGLKVNGTYIRTSSRGGIRLVIAPQRNP